MQVHREFHNPNVVRQLEEIDENLLAEMLEDIRLDREIGKAMAASKALDGHEKNLTLQEFLDQECR